MTRMRETVSRKIRDSAIYAGYIHRNLLNTENVAYFPALGLAYNRIKKSGNTTILAFISELEGNDYRNADDLKKQVLSPAHLGWRQAIAFRRAFLFTFVRNPYTRVLSAFLDKVGRAGREDLAHVPGFSDASPEGFERFVSFLDQDGWLINRHFWPQSELLCAKPERYDHIGKLENIVGDMEEVLDRVGLPAEKARTLEKPHSLQKHQTGAGDKLQSFYSGPVIDTIRKVYTRDFSLFGYSRDFPG